MTVAEVKQIYGADFAAAHKTYAGEREGAPVGVVRSGDLEMVFWPADKNFGDLADTDVVRMIEQRKYTTENWALGC